MKPAIRVENLAKSYRLGSNTSGYRTLRETITNAAANAWYGLRSRRDGSKNGTDQDNAFWALKDVSFEVQPGEVVGIIGRNGAGKSTLLKILSRITEPSEGRCEVRGRIASLLEVGTGFHPELSGRENIYMNGSLLGMSRKEIDRKFDEIVDFSEIEQFIDTPVKRYSSGMYVRLAFAVAAQLEPEILIVDEILAVGDVGFQNKCLGKMSEAAGGGRTVIFVSHQMQAVSQLAKRCLTLDAGKKIDEGSSHEVIRKYLKQFQQRAGDYYKSMQENGNNHIEWVKVITSEGNGVHFWGKPICFEFCLNVVTSRDSLCFSFNIVNERNERVCHWWLLDSNTPFRRKTGRFLLRLHVPKLRLYMGDYTLTTWLSEKRSNHMEENLIGICPFQVHMTGQSRPEYQWYPGETVYLEEGNWLPIDELS